MFEEKCVSVNTMQSYFYGLINEEKRVWLRDNEPEYYAEFVGEDKDIFTLWKEKGYI